jgi:hypothetical protein
MKKMSASALQRLNKSISSEKKALDAWKRAQKAKEKAMKKYK